MTSATAELRDEVIRLGPWHMEVEITPELTTAAYLELLELEGRHTRRFPYERASSAGRSAVAQLEDLRGEGTGYLLIPATAHTWPERESGLKEHLEQDDTLAWRGSGVCDIFLLGPAPG